MTHKLLIIKLVACVCGEADEQGPHRTSAWQSLGRKKNLQDEHTARQKQQRLEAGLLPIPPPCLESMIGVLRWEGGALLLHSGVKSFSST